MSGPKDSINPRVLLKGLVFIATLVGIGFLIRETGLKSLIDTHWIDAEIRGRGVTGELLFLAIGAFFTGVGLPRQIVSFLGGYAFGFVTGTLVALGATTLGCIGAFYYARFLGRAVVAHRFPGRIRRADEFLKDNPVATTLLIRLLPVGSNVATNLIAGVSSVPAAPFFVGSALGFVPQTAIFALVGSGIDVAPEFRITLGVALFLVSGIIGFYLYRRNKAARALAENGNGEDA